MSALDAIAFPMPIVPSAGKGSLRPVGTRSTCIAEDETDSTLDMSVEDPELAHQDPTPNVNAAASSSKSEIWIAPSVDASVALRVAGIDAYPASATNSDLYKNAVVVVLAEDSDEESIEKAAIVAHSVRSIAAEVRIAETNWIELRASLSAGAEHTTLTVSRPWSNEEAKADLERAKETDTELKAMPVPKVGRLFSEITPGPAVSWLWPFRIPAGAITFFEGDGERGKSTVLIDLAARISSKRPMPCVEE